MNTRDIASPDIAKEYILDELEKKYGEKFSTDVEVETIASGDEDQFISYYLLRDVYPVSDPTVIFGAYCYPYGGGVLDTRGELIFKEDAEELASAAFGDDTQHLASYDVRISMFGTTRTWKEGDSFEEFLDTGAIPPHLVIKLYLKSELSTKECASQVFSCYQAMIDSGVPFEMRACYEGGDVDKYPFFLWNTTANPWTYDSEESVLEDIEHDIEFNETIKEMQ